MKPITVFFTVLLVGGFILFTSNQPWVHELWNRGAKGEQIWTGPDVVKSAGLSADELNNIEVYQKAHSATVNITTVVYRQDWFFRVIPEPGSGSGFLVDSEGRILTNSHVVRGSRSKITVTLADGSRHEARLLTFDRENDLALLQINAGKNLPFLRLGESDGLKVGQKVLAIGNPFGLEGTLTTGIISSLGRSVQGDGDTILEDMIQTDAAINPGNSGGPLLDSGGSVIGINTAIYGPGSNIGIGFAMPIDRAKVMLDEYSKKGYFSRPALGARVLFLPEDWAEALELPSKPGLLVLGVEGRSSAAKAGLKGADRMVMLGQYEIPYGGDYILKIDGQDVVDKNSLRRALVRKRPGDPLELTIFRGGRTLSLTITLDERREATL